MLFPILATSVKQSVKTNGQRIKQSPTDFLALELTSSFFPPYFIQGSETFLVNNVSYSVSGNWYYLMVHISPLDTSLTFNFLSFYWMWTSPCSITSVSFLLQEGSPQACYAVNHQLPWEEVATMASIILERLLAMWDHTSRQVSWEFLKWNLKWDGYWRKLKLFWNEDVIFFYIVMWDRCFFITTLQKSWMPIK